MPNYDWQERAICRRCNEMLDIDQFRYLRTRNVYNTRCIRCERAVRAEQRSNAAASGNRATRRSTRSSAAQTGRAFGVEIELTGPEDYDLQEALSAIGIDVHRRDYASTNGSRWELKYDGSVGGAGLELVSPKLYGDEGMETLRKVLRAINSVGASVDHSCGIHVHIDFRGKTIEQIRNSILPIVEAQDLFYEMVAPSRRNNCYSPGWEADEIEALRNATNLEQLNYLGPRGNVNVGSYPRHGSIEFRSHGGSTNYRKISAWIRVLMAAIDRGETQGPGATLGNSLPDLFYYLRTSSRDQVTLNRFNERRRAAEDAAETDEYRRVDADAEANDNEAVVIDSFRSAAPVNIDNSEPITPQQILESYEEGCTCAGCSDARIQAGQTVEAF